MGHTKTATRLQKVLCKCDNLQSGAPGTRGILCDYFFQDFVEMLSTCFVMMGGVVGRGFKKTLAFFFFF